MVVAELHGPRFNDKTIHRLAKCNGIPKIKLCNTGLSRHGIEKLRELLPNSIVEEGIMKESTRIYAVKQILEWNSIPLLFVGGFTTLSFSMGGFFGSVPSRFGEFTR